MSDDMPVMPARREICHKGRLGATMWHHMYRKMERIGIDCLENYFYVLLIPRTPTLLTEREIRQHKRIWSVQQPCIKHYNILEMYFQQVNQNWHNGTVAIGSRVSREVTFLSLDFPAGTAGCQGKRDKGEDLRKNYTLIIYKRLMLDAHYKILAFVFGCEIQYVDQTESSVLPIE